MAPVAAAIDAVRMEVLHLQRPLGVHLQRRLRGDPLELDGVD